MAKKITAEIGVFGGSGFYSFFEKAQTVNVKTPYGLPSAPITIAEISGKRVAFLPRHGLKHQFPPHKVPYKANVYALKKLGVKTIISPCAAGSLQAKIKPGNFVILDQFINLTYNRGDTFYDGPKTTHIAGADPYCPALRKIADKACKKLKIKMHSGGTVAVVNGPRFSTTSESMYFTRQGWQVINMTQYPEVVLSREQEICFLGIALITDFDAGVVAKGKVKPVSNQEVIKVFNNNLDKAKKLVLEIIDNIPSDHTCSCHQALLGASMNP